MLLRLNIQNIVSIVPLICLEYEFNSAVLLFFLLFF